MTDLLQIALDKTSNLLLKATSDKERHNFDNVIDILKFIKHEKHYEGDKLELSQEMFDKLISGTVNTENVLEALETLHINRSNGKNGRPEQKCNKGQKRAGIAITTNMLEILIEHSESAELLVRAMQMLDAVKFSPVMKNRILDAIKLYPDHINEIVHGVSLLADDDDVAMEYLSRLNSGNVKNAFALANKISELEIEEQLTPGDIDMIFSGSLKDLATKPKEQSETDDKTKIAHCVTSSESVLGHAVPLLAKSEKFNTLTDVPGTLLNHSIFKAIKPAKAELMPSLNQSEDNFYSLD
ncbi:hypothetical protein OQJ13_00695 [Legionella sp. PATHC035]|uniref:hypothetical protein n=1 Tax=Legionella sp. PATHC035 TaxID=2992040 RepID=UPI002243FC3B|nr:hypothetical protein [Legionella sp. PATHC035]MCW8407490.1 hypothetical protein [Legionella sp. PATHC035]